MKSHSEVISDQWNNWVRMIDMCESRYSLEISKSPLTTMRQDSNKTSQDLGPLIPRSLEFPDSILGSPT